MSNYCEIRHVSRKADAPAPVEMIPPGQPMGGNPLDDIDRWMKLIEHGAGFLDRFLIRATDLVATVKGIENRARGSSTEPMEHPMEEQEQIVAITPEQADQRARDKHTKAEALLEEFIALAQLGLMGDPNMTVKALLETIESHRGPLVSGIAGKL